MSRVSSLKSEGKPFEISKQEVWEAWEKVRSKKGGPGIDGQTLQDFEANLKGNLYKIWNRLSSGSYFPPPVKAVEIPKIGGTRVLGVPTVADRIAQTVAARRLEARVEPIFHADSYGYRPGRSPLDAVAACRERCWKYGWAIDLDVQKFFDTVPWDLIVKAVMAHGDDPWVVLYVKRWLRAPLVLPDGTVQERNWLGYFGWICPSLSNVKPGIHAGQAMIASKKGRRNGNSDTPGGIRFEIPNPPAVASLQVTGLTPTVLGT